MLSRTNRRLTVLALALGLIAAAPRLFHLVTDARPFWLYPGPPLLMLSGESTERSSPRSVEIRGGLFYAAFVSLPHESWFAWEVHLNPTRRGGAALPDESITLRVACVVALGGVWLLIVCGRLLVRQFAGGRSRIDGTKSPEAYHE